MSVEAVLEFWQAAQDDEALQASLAAAIEGKDHDSALAEVLRIGGDAGFEFSEDEYEAARKELPKLVLVGDDAAEGEVSGFAQTIGSRLTGTGGALRPGGILRRNGLLNGSLGSTSALYTDFRRY
jgi:hypothetical protein